MPSTRRPPGDRPVRASVHTYRVAPASVPPRRSTPGGPRAPSSPPGLGGPDRGRRGRRTWRQRGVLVLGSVAATTCLLGAAVVGYGWARWRSVDRVGLDTDAAPAGDPVNFLLVGSDSRAGEGTAEQEAVEGQRTDTIMVLRLDPAAEEVSVLSFPRDLWVTLGDVRELADRLGSLDDDALRTLSLPVLPRPGDDGSTLVVDEQAADPVLAEFRGDEPADVSPADIEEPTPLDQLPTPPSGVTTQSGDGPGDPGGGAAVDTTAPEGPTTTSPALVGAVPDGAC